MSSSFKHAVEPGPGWYVTHGGDGGCGGKRPTVGGRGEDQPGSTSAPCSDAKAANREIRVWHFVIEKGY